MASLPACQRLIVRLEMNAKAYAFFLLSDLLLRHLGMLGMVYLPDLLEKLVKPETTKMALNYIDLSMFYIGVSCLYVYYTISNVSRSIFPALLITLFSGFLIFPFVLINSMKLHERYGYDYYHLLNPIEFVYPFIPTIIGLFIGRAIVIFNRRASSPA